MNISTKGSPVFSFTLSGEANPSVTPLPRSC